MTRVTLLARPATGGIRTHLLELLKRLPRDHWSIGLLAPGELLRDLPPDLPAFESIRCRITARQSLCDLTAARTVRRTVASAPGLVHAHGIRAGFVAALANSSRRFPLVVTFHNMPPDTPLASAALRFIDSRSTELIAVSNAIASKVSPRTRVIPNGVDLSAYRVIDRASSRKLYGLGESQVAVVCASRLSLEKGLSQLIAAAANLPEVEFRIAGDGPERASLKELIRKLGVANIRMLGRIDSVPTLLAAADIACIPSLTEGQGIFALEAMAAGVAVVVSNVGGLPEMIEDGVTGLLVPAGSADAIGAAIRRLAGATDLRESLGRAAQARANEIGDINAMVKRIEAVYAGIPGI